MRIQSNNALTTEPAKPEDVAAGKVKTYKGAMATGFMVSPCYMLTNYHAVFGLLANPDISKFSVTVNLPDGQQAIARPELKGPTDTNGYVGDSGDWALLKLDKCVGEKIGWMERGDPEVAQAKGFSYYVAGFPGDIAKLDPKAQLVISGKCALKDDVQGSHVSWRHDCPMTHGSSGAPVFYKDQNGVPRYVGMNASEANGKPQPYPEWTPETSNFAVGLTAGRIKRSGGKDWAELWRRVDADQKKFGKSNPSLQGFPAEVFSDPQGQVPQKLITDPKI
jgi:V8-like Glu-specific endopeptidase